MKIFKFRTLTASVLCVSLLMSTGAYANAQETSSNITVALSGAVLTFDVAPYVNDSYRTMVEVRGISEALGADITWDEEAQTVTIVMDDTVLKLVIGETNYTINGESNTMDTEAVIIDGRTMVPVRFVSEALGMNVGWNASEKKVTISKAESKDLTYPIVDTEQGYTYSNLERIEAPAEGEAFYAQDAQYTGTLPSYTDNGNGTVSDNVTDLMWAQDLSTASMSWEAAGEYCENLELGGYDDWRLPTVKELWSLRNYSQGWPWIDTDFFSLVGDGTDARQQHSWSSNAYLVVDEYQNEQVVGSPSFIVNDWTGHIKAMSGNRFVRAVRGTTSYGINDFVDNDDSTITDNATGLMWSKDDSGVGMNWEAALAYAEGSEYAGYYDWRLPNVKELQSIADYSGVFPAMDTSMFNLTELTNIMGQTDYPFYWSSTSNPVESGDGEVETGTVYAWALAAGYNTDPDGYDLHGAGSIVFVPKSEENFSELDPEIHRYNYVRLVRGGDVTETPEGDLTTIDTSRIVIFEDGDTGMGDRPTGAPMDDTSIDGTNGPGQQMIDTAAAAEKLGVTEEALINAIGEPGQGEPDFAGAASTLGITEADLMDALGL
ncbi:MAG: DUF1566 domain-containing protein [Sedimentibacter sp.]